MLINLPLFEAMCTQQRNTTFGISFGIVLYEGLLTWVYPAITKTPAVTEIVEAIPSTVKTVFGVSADARTDTFEAYISSQFFTRIWTMIMAFYGINTADALLAKLVDDGSLCFPLSCPISRSQLLTTQAAVLFANNSFLILMTYAGLFLGTKVSGIPIDKSKYLKLSLLSFFLFSVISSYALLFSTLVTKEKSLAYAYGLTFMFYGLDVIAGLSDQLTWTKHLSLFHLFKPQEVLEGTVNPTGIITGLSISAGILLFIAVQVFKKKDLPL